MADWEFLIQKEGDRSWLPLDSPNVEILEGRYRVVARASQVNMPVEIRVIHLATQEMPPRRRVQKRASQTNETGLVAVLPFTQLQAGIWELQCGSADLMSDLLGNSWQHTIRLQVQPQLVEEDWETDWPADTTESEETAQTATTELMQRVPHSHQAHPFWIRGVTDPVALPTSADRLLEMAEVSNHADDLVSSDSGNEQALESTALSRAVAINAESQETATVGSETVTEAPATPVTSPDWLRDSTRKLTLRLEQPGLVASHGQAVMVAGWVEIQFDGEGQTPSEQAPGLEAQSLDSKTASPQEIQLWLRDPQTLEVISSDRQSFPNLVPPFLFTFSFTLPTRLATHLILGEVLLCGKPPDSQDDLIPIDTQAFSITVNPAEWISPTPDEAAPSEEAQQPVDEAVEPEEGSVSPIQLPSLEPPVLTPAETPLDLELSFLLSPEEAEKRSGKLYKILPPQIYHPNTEAAASRSLELPQFAIAKPVDSTEQMADAVESSASVTQESGIDVTTPADVEPDLQATERSLVDDTLTSQDDSDSAIELPDQTAETSSDIYVSNSELVVAQDSPATNVELSSEVESQIEDELPCLEQDQLLLSSSHKVNGQDLDKLDSISAEETDDDSVSVPEEAEDPYLVAANQAFKALNLHDRFLSRLSSLATDLELATWLKAGGEQPQQVEQTLETPMPVTPQPDFLAYEIVVDEASEAAPRRSGWMQPSHSTEATPADQAMPTALPDQPIDLVVPVPELNLASGELISGELVQLRVRLPEADVGFYAKVWITDCETRQLLDGPHWLVDFLPNGFGGQDAFVQLTVPFGSTAVQFEAIGFEIHSQCESRKAIAMRPVVPPDLPIVTFDEFSDRL